MIRTIAITITILLAHITGYTQSRKVTNLNKGWEFVLVDDDYDYVNLNEHSWTKVDIPHTWNSKDIQSGEKVHYGTGWYKKNIVIEKATTTREYFLNFEGAGQYAEVYINNIMVEKHLGSYSAFTFNITDFIIPDTSNLIVVKVNNELTDSYPKDNFLFGIYGGIYRNIKLIETNDVHLCLTDYASSGVYVRQKNISNKKATLEIEALPINETSESKNIVIKNKLLNHNNEIVTESTVNKKLFPGGVNPVFSDLIIKNPTLWNGRSNPYLYTLETEIIIDETIVDKISQNIGIRYFEVDPERGFILNGEPYRLYGVCRHQEWEDMGNALLPEHHRKDMEMIYELGATSVRLAHYQQAGLVYHLADSLGLLIWAEIPFVNGYKKDADDNAKQQMRELIKQNFNHPSIFVWGVHNEVIKNGIVNDPVRITKELNTICKTMDPDRYTVSVSNIWWVKDHRIHENTNLQGFNQYTGWYGGKPEQLERWINNYHKSKPDIRISISEYGAGGNILQQTSELFPPPDPGGRFFPEGYQTYYHEVTYSSIEKYPFIWASYVWNMFDFAVPEWDRGGVKGRNHKGLVTYDRNTKKDAYYWYKANWSEDPVLYLTGRRNDIIETDTCIIKAYSNKGTPVLYIDGTEYGEMQQGINKVQYVSRPLTLKKGEHNIEIKTLYNNEYLTDNYDLVIQK